MKFRKNIVFAINHLGIGGAENLVVEQVNHVDRNLFKPFLITILPNPNSNLSHQLLPDIIYTKFNFRGFKNIFSCWNLWRFFRKEKIDIVITNLFDTNSIVRFVALLAGVKTILSYEHSIYENKKRWQIFIDKTLSLFTKKIIVGSNDVLEFTSKQEGLPKEKFCLNYNAIPLIFSKTKQFRDTVLSEYGLSKNYLYIVTAGRLIKQKGHKYLIDAVKIMRKKGLMNFKVLIFGKGILETELKEQISLLGLEQDVKLMGLGKIEKILAISDIFVMPSLWEGLSIALLQAMNSGSPIVATKVSGSNEAIINNESGLLVEPADSDKLALALSSLIGDSNLRSLLAHGATERAKKFSIETNIKTIEKLALL